MSQPSFWDNQETAQKVISEINQIKSTINAIVAYQKQVDDLTTLIEMVEESGDEEGEEYLEEVATTAGKLLEELDNIEIQSFLTGPHDKCNAIMSIHSGAGGTESCDWAEMLLRMYRRWAERRGFEIEIQDIQPGEEAGISRASFRIIGPHEYGYEKAERGVHRLVRDRKSTV